MTQREVALMLSEEHVGYALELRRLLRNGALDTTDATADLDGGVVVPLHLAVRIVLNDLDELISEEQDGPGIDQERWRQLGSELANLYWLAIKGR
jgi:hypothetical protein